MPGCLTDFFNSKVLIFTQTHQKHARRGYCTICINPTCGFQLAGEITEVHAFANLSTECLIYRLEGRAIEIRILQHPDSDDICLFLGKSTCFDSNIHKHSFFI